MAVSLLTHFGGSVSFGASSAAVKRRGQRFVQMSPFMGATQLRLPETEKLGGSGLYYIVHNQGVQGVVVVDASLSTVGTLSPSEMAFVFYDEDPDGLSGTWIVVGAGNWTAGNQGPFGDIATNYGSVGEPMGTRLDFGTVQLETSPIDLSFGTLYIARTPVWETP